MGMPIITPGTGTREQAIADLIESVALQETALSHILNAEGEKMQAIISMPGATAKQLMELNSTVNKLINAVTVMEMTMQSKLGLFTSETPPDTTTAAEQLAKISVTNVAISIPLSDSEAMAAAADQAVAAAQAQVAPGYTVTRRGAGYNDSGILRIRFIVTNDTDPLDTATDAAERIIGVISTITTAEKQLALINVPTVSIGMPLNDPAARITAVAQAIAAAQSQVAPGYTVGFNDSSYDSATGTLTGFFYITTPDGNSDNARDSADRIIYAVV